MAPRIHSVATLADHWGCSTDTIYALVKSGELPHFNLGGKLIRIRGDEVERFECRSIPSEGIAASSSWSGTNRDDATDMRLERLIERQPSRRATT